MEKYRAMKETKEMLNLLVILVIVPLCFCAVATACPPACPPCQEWNGQTEECDPMANGTSCGKTGFCKECQGGECVYKDDNDCEEDEDCSGGCCRCAGCKCTDMDSECEYCQKCDGCGCDWGSIEDVESSLESPFLCVGGYIMFTVETDPAYWDHCVEWSGGGEPCSTQEGGQTFYTGWYTSGTKEVTASWCGGTSSKSKQVKVIEVGSISEDTTKACVNEDITFTANPSPSGPLDCMEWQYHYRPDSTSEWEEWTRVIDEDETTVLNTSTAGYYQYQAKNHVHDEGWKLSSEVVIVKVDKLQYNDPMSGWIDIPGTLYVHKSDSIEFKAIKKPLDASWPSGKPVWGGTSGASGTGETKEVTFNTLSSNATDYKTVTATCCNDTETANVIVCEVEVTDIQFDHDNPASGHNDALDIRENASTNISIPEWVKDGQNKPAAYVKSLSNVDIKARFSISPYASPTTKILATTGSSILGNINEVSGITFSYGTSGYVRFTAAGSTPSSIDKGTVQWQWKVKDFGQGSGEININTSGSHTIYTVLDTPVSPQAEPWTEVLDFSCYVAGGQNDKMIVTRTFFYNIYLWSGGSYDTEYGSSQYTGATSTSFNLTDFLSNYQIQEIGIVNCYDMGKAVVIFANSLGCGASYSFVFQFGYLNCIKPIGKGWTNNPFYDHEDNDSNPIVDGDWDSSDGRSLFWNHGFSRLGSDIFDASGGRVDVDGDPDGSPHNARYLDGNDTWSNDYTDRVIDDNPSSSPASPVNYSFGVY